MVEESGEAGMWWNFWCRRSLRHARRQSPWRWAPTCTQGSESLVMQPHRHCLPRDNKLMSLPR